MTENYDLKQHIRTIPDYPKQGIMFRDITSLLAHGEGLRQSIEMLARPYLDQNIAAVAGIEARGFILGGAVAERLGTGFIPLRKAGKLPYHTLSQEYDLEYGTDRLEIHQDALDNGDRILLIDDLIATGGTALAGAALIRKLGGIVAGAAFIIDLPDLGGRAKLEGDDIPCQCLVAYEGH